MPPHNPSFHQWQPRHRNCFFLDISRFTGTDEAAQAHRRATVQNMVEHTARDLDIRWRPGLHSDRGDGLALVTKCGIEVLVHDLPWRLGGAVRRHNQTVAPDLQVRLRMAVDAGFLVRDHTGYSGDALNRAARLLDAPEFKIAMRDQGAEFAVIISAELYEAIQGFHLLDDRKIGKVQVDVKETHTTAWMWTP
ncbi:hypothetical protein SAMN04489713_104432 [Actinomadura madurae]|uniref:Guanylate cyclase domain-containing protein n=2 Tax=Thermomonosporaceae TaxID=2012 RepID=A0A1I5F5F2_9ACTN|nr:hypothetical protein SAMN04489713_104432 [Actinomadura madurae]